MVANADGSARRAVSEPGAFTQFAWRPDGGLYVAAAPDFEPRPRLGNVDSAPAWSPSGKRLAVAAGSPSAIRLVDPGGGAIRLDVRCGDPSWEPRGLPATALRGTPLAHRYTAPPDGR